MSTYSSPDKTELNFHAGIMLRHQFRFSTHHSGVQLSNGGEFEDMLLDAGLALQICSSPDLDVSLVRIDMATLPQELIAFVRGRMSNISFQHANQPFCKTI